MTRVGLLAITRNGLAHARQLLAHWPPDWPPAQLCTSDKFAADLQNNALAQSSLQRHCHYDDYCYSGPLSAQIPTLLQQCDPLVCFVSLGAVVRLVAPHLHSKERDPAIVVVDDAARFVIPVLSGHIGGANAWSERIAAVLGAVPVITTASDVQHSLAVDLLGQHLGWRIEAPKINLTRVAAHVVNGEPIALVQEAGSSDWWTRSTPLPSHIHCFARFDAVDLNRYRALLWITHTPVPPELWQRLHERLVVYRPPQGQGLALAVGLGCDRGTPLATVQYALDAALAQVGAQWQHVCAVASITLKADEAALLALAQQYGWDIVFYRPEELAGVAVPNPSETVRRYTGTPSVSEAAALLVAGRARGKAQALPMQALRVEKFKHRGPDGRNATVSIAQCDY